MAFTRAIASSNSVLNLSDGVSFGVCFFGGAERDLDELWLRRGSRSERRLPFGPGVDKRCWTAAATSLASTKSGSLSAVTLLLPLPLLGVALAADRLAEAARETDCRVGDGLEYASI